jgi:hypothetical protein
MLKEGIISTINSIDLLKELYLNREINNLQNDTFDFDNFKFYRLNPNGLNRLNQLCLLIKSFQ